MHLINSIFDTNVSMITGPISKLSCATAFFQNVSIANTYIMNASINSISSTNVSIITASITNLSFVTACFQNVSLEIFHVSNAFINAILTSNVSMITASITNLSLATARFTNYIILKHMCYRCIYLFSFCYEWQYYHSIYHQCHFLRTAFISKLSCATAWFQNVLTL